ncbi:MAG: response regulator, partial [Myxococcota bacterium]
APAPVAVDDPGVLELPGPHPAAPLVVVAEDEPDLRRFIADVLAERYAVVACPNGAVALEAVARQPDLVVTDRDMPELDGVGFIRELRAADQVGEVPVPVIMLTAHGGLDTVLEAYAAGADDYVTKPFHARELLARAQAQLRLRQLTRDAMTRERLATVGELATQVAHHLRNPLNIVVNGLPLFEKGLKSNPERAQKMRDLMAGALERIDQLVKDLHDAGSDPDGPRRHDPRGLVRSAVRMVRSVSPGVTIDLDEKASGLVIGQPGPLTQLVLHLARWAVREAGVEGRVRLTLDRTEEFVVLWVEDSGSGMEDAHAERLFDVVVSQDASRHLALSTVAQIAQDHHGTASASRSEALGGMRLEVQLPIARDPEPELVA